MGAATVDKAQAVTDPDLNGSGDTSELTLEGTNGQLTFGVGGKHSTTSSLRLVGGKVDIQGRFEKGERLVLHVECEVREVAFRDDIDGKTGQVVGCERKHQARITGVERA